jgi:hypothetical protein
LSVVSSLELAMSTDTLLPEAPPAATASAGDALTQVVILKGDQTLRDDELLPGFELRLADVLPPREATTSNRNGEEAWGFLQLEVLTDGEQVTTPVKIVVGGTTPRQETFLVEELEPGQEYQYRFHAYDGIEVVSTSLESVQMPAGAAAPAVTDPFVYADGVSASPDQTFVAEA